MNISFCIYLITFFSCSRATTYSIHKKKEKKTRRDKNGAAIDGDFKRPSWTVRAFDVSTRAVECLRLLLLSLLSCV